ncbi:MAG: HD domain-containing protein [Candidatus Liptonbacteria bacterium]|nr:HD domain-containing protein [Candidatus Liptonbacteria bacterium]
MKYRSEDIFTPQGILEEVEHNPNLDLLMNIFNIPRAFGVSGFGGNWNVGMHSVASAFIALYWAKFNKFDEAKTNKLAARALLHDLHEAVTGDILPMFKTKTSKARLKEIQKNIVTALNMKEEEDMEIDLKIVDLVAFYYEIRQVSPNILHPRKLKLAHTMAERQLAILVDYAKENKIKKSKIQQFLQFLNI